MPSRKHGASDTPHESRRASLRRLSSIASIQQLNPFSRRKSNNNTDSTVASSSSSISHVSATSLAVAPLDSSIPSSDIHTADPEDQGPGAHPSTTQHKVFRLKDSYKHLPDEPNTWLPKSRTFSTLPLPKSKSTRRFPPTRLPSPTTTTRRHTPTRLGSLATRSFAKPVKGTGRAGMVRSDTEPLLSGSRAQRSTAFKENITMSPIKPPLLSESSYSSNQSYSSPLPNMSMPNTGSWLDRDFSSSPTKLMPCSMMSESHLSQPETPPVSPKQKGTWSFHKSKDRPPTPATIQRWDSQPILTTSTNTRTRTSYGAEIKQTRLMSARHPPTPPPPCTPLTAKAMTTGRVKAMSNASSHLRQVSELSPSLLRISPKPPPTPPKNPFHVSTSEPAAYWSGRFSALNDRYRNEELAKEIYCSKDKSDQMHSAEAITGRMRPALVELHGYCTTEAARESFGVFQLQYAALQNNPVLGQPIAIPRSKARETVVVGEDCSASMSRERKMSFMERLLGRSRRSLA